MNNPGAVFTWILVAIVSIGLGFIINKSWTLGSDESDYEIVCLGGHQYWRANFATKGFLGIKLKPDGTPVRCVP